MKVFGWLSCIVVTAVTVAAAKDAKEPPKELQIETTFKPDECPHEAQKGDHIEVHYTGSYFASGNKFDSSFDHGGPLPLTLGAGQIIPGWDQGLVGMCLNEKRNLTIPSDLAYGPRGIDAALVFAVELVGLKPVGREEL